ncbi:hypothetical protein [Candidatus Palauibacter sp.]|uniref:hypothetical protein n=1 Tax=Candidatus Palauibacter sp. TaxID=3101350 RepID=UPI003C70225D
MKRALMVLGSAVLLSGCSVIFLNKPPPGDGPLPTGSCTMSKAAPIFDVIGSANYALPAILSDADLEDIGLPSGTAARAFWAAGAAGLAYSAVTGFKSTSECRRRQLMSEQAIADHLRTLAREIAEGSTG